ncbi:MAG: DUF4249 domain-containing protein [Bacteroidales bacterium]
MNKLVYGFHAILLSTLLLQACEDVVRNDDISGIQPKLVVFSYISPQSDSIIVRVTLSETLGNPSYYYEPKWVDNAVVTFIAPGFQTLAVPYDYENRFYTASLDNFQVVSGQSYELQVTTPDGYHTIGKCQIPPLNTSIRMTALVLVEGQYNSGYKVRVEFDDPQGSPDYYRVDVTALISEQYPWQPPYEWETPVYFNYGESLIDVGGRDGKTFVLEGEFWTYGAIYDGETIIKGLRLTLLSTDEHYYRFHRSLENYQGDNPFAEPILIYSNFTDGLGVFGAYNSSQLYHPVNE